MSTNTGPATNQCIYHYWCRSRGQWHNIDFPCESRFKCVDRNGAQSLNIKVSFIEELIMKVPVLVISPIVSKYCGVNIGTTWRWEDWTNMISTSIMVDMCRRLENYKRDKLHVACRHWTLIPLYIWPFPILDLHMLFLLRQISFSKTCRYFPRHCTSNIPQYFDDLSCSY